MSKYGNLTYRKTGNGTETNYDYDERQLHQNAISLTSNGVRMMDNVFTYDNVDNILGISNAVSRDGGKIFSYDADGNPVSVEDTTANTLRIMQRDEEGRLQSLGDDGYVSRYTYSGLATMVRIMLMYYVNCYTFLEEPEKDWAKMVQEAKETPPEPSLFD